MKDKPVKRIPYGISDFTAIAEGNFYYVDKTEYLKHIEEAGNYLFFIRPRRFGKSLFLSMIKCYYDVLYKDQFENLFKGTRIFNNPTRERGQYLVLSMNFSSVDPAPDLLERSFREMIRKRALVFIDQYADYIGKQRDYFAKEIETAGSPADILTALLSLCQLAGQKLYVIIDEYDNFTNTILAASGDKAYHDLTHEDGFLRSFFNVLKSGTGDTGAPISRLFITGVSPVTMDDVTSGFNIGLNVSLDSNLNRMLGFTVQEVSTMIDYYRHQCEFLRSAPGLMEILTQWYGCYGFSGKEDQGLYNSDMILYFVSNCLREGELPEEMIDRNVRMDYGKLRHLIVMDGGPGQRPVTNGNFSKLKQIIAEGHTLTNLSRGFPLKDLTKSHNFKSLLFYFGLLTIAGRERDRYRLEIPNETVKRLYFDYINEAYRETGVFSLDLDRYAGLISDMAYDGSWRPLFEFITSRIKESLALRDLMVGEKAVQAFLHVYLGLSDLFIVHSEKELNKGFADLVMLPLTAKYPALKFSFLVELKYIKAGTKAVESKIKQLVAEAETQLENYAADEKFLKAVGSTQLIKLVLIFSGHEVVYIGEVKGGG